MGSVTVPVQDGSKWFQFSARAVPQAFSVFRHGLTEGAVPVSVPEKQVRRCRFRFRFLEKRFRWFRFPVFGVAFPKNLVRLFLGDNLQR